MCRCMVLVIAGIVSLMAMVASQAQETCEAAIDCFGNAPVGEWPNCRCPSCGMDHLCEFPDAAEGAWPKCFCVRPPPVDPGGAFNPCQAACPVGSGSGTWPACVCEPSASCNPLACPVGSQMVGQPPFCRCEAPQFQPPPG